MRAKSQRLASVALPDGFVTAGLTFFDTTMDKSCRSCKPGWPRQTGRCRIRCRRSPRAVEPGILTFWNWSISDRRGLWCLNEVIEFFLNDCSKIRHL